MCHACGFPRLLRMEVANVDFIIPKLEQKRSICSGNNDAVSDKKAVQNSIRFTTN